jgi:hypothetical protein
MMIGGWYMWTLNRGGSAENVTIFHYFTSNNSYAFQVVSFLPAFRLISVINFLCPTSHTDRLCGLVVRVLGYRSGGPGSIPGTTRKKIVGLEWGPLSLVNTTEELLERKVAAPVYKIENTAVGIRHADHVAPSIRISWQSLRRQAAVARSV